MLALILRLLGDNFSAITFKAQESAFIRLFRVVISCVLCLPEELDHPIVALGFACEVEHTSDVISFATTSTHPSDSSVTTGSDGRT